MPSSSRSLSRPSAYVLALVVVVLPLSRGGVPIAVEGVALVLALSAFWMATAREPTLPPAALPLGGVLIVAALQIVPVPVALHSLSPGAVRVFDVSLAPLGLYPGMRPLSLDPAASAHEFAKAAACILAFATAWHQGGSERRRAVIVQGLALACISVTAVVLGAALIGSGDLLAPRFPFVNPNHLAGFLNLCAFVVLGLALRTRGQARVLWAMAFVCAGALVFLTLSRAGIGAFLLGAAVSLVLLTLSRWTLNNHRIACGRTALVAALAAALATAAYLALDPILAELRTLKGAQGDIKVRLLVPALQLLRDYPLFGTGAGAFPTVFTQYQSEVSSVTFTHLENEWIQPMLDLGIPAGVTLVVTFAWIWVAAARRNDLTPTSIGLLAGTAAVAAQNAFDFSIGILGVGFPFATMMGLLAREQRPVRVPRLVLRSTAVLLLVVGISALVLASLHDLERDRDNLARANGADTAEQAARAALRWHPADWISHATAGVRLAATRGCGRGMPWLVRAMLLDPYAPEPHLATARCLAGRDDPAAKREYRLAFSYGYRNALPEAAARYSKLDDLLDVAPFTPQGLLELSGVLETMGRPREAAVVLSRVIAEFQDERAILPLARTKLALREHAAALDLARQHTRAHPSDAEGWLVSAKSLIWLQRAEEARSELEKGLAGLPGSPALLGYLAEIAIASKRWSEAKRLAEEVAPQSPTETAAKHLLVSRALAGQGRFNEAVERARSATAVDPDARLPWLALSYYAKQAAQNDVALDALRHAAALPSARPGEFADDIHSLEAAVTAERDRILERRALNRLVDPDTRR